MPMATLATATAERLTGVGASGAALTVTGGAADDDGRLFGYRHLKWRRW